jgi:hypothetical protein
MRVSFLSASLILGCTLSATAQERAKPNTLTPKEVADGWVLLFDGETMFGWQLKPLHEPGGGKPALQVQDNVLFLKTAPFDRAAMTTTTHFGDFGLNFEYRRESTGVPTLLIWPRDLKMGIFELNLYKDGWNRDTVTLHEKELTFEDRFGKTQKKPWASREQPIIFRAVEALKLRDIKLRPLGAKPLFNGKDLTGWKVFPGKKSEFAVEDGAIVCRNGPGDLQTEGKYANFVLQLECKSNGKHLNSGIFFRCKANEYQNGYEAQIHNNFTADPPKQYTVEEYDPETHKLTGKKKVASAAVDYGTGAIYRRVPARKEVAKDGEWFTMTIVAHGNHIATWVNGIQQVDWYDNRPASDNPRTGCRLEAGHISIQGHDPTTDLSFRNIRIAELPAK